MRQVMTRSGDDLIKWDDYKRRAALCGSDRAFREIL